jgi:L-iditol 2-dehydrogenase
MLAAVWHGPNDMRLENKPVPEVLPGTVLVKVEACAICGSDLRIMGDGNPRINPPHILGHEISGEIVKLGAGVNNYALGDRISTGADVPCGKCSHCKSGRPNCCDTNLAIGYQFDGGFAEYILLDPLVVKHGPMQKFSEKLSWNNASLAEPLACCINGYERAFYDQDTGGTIVIFGAGPIGLMLLMLGINYYNVDQIVIVEPSKIRRQIASQLGADLVINPDNLEPVQSVMDYTNQQGANLIFTACPVVKTHTQAIEMVAKRGVVNFFGGVPKTDLPISLLSNFIHYREAYITGSHGSTPRQHSMALDLIDKGVIDISKVVTNSLSLSDIHDGFAIAASGTSAKVIINPGMTKNHEN